ncbi:sigma 54-interacting transcriptional regulator [Sandaracinus amylolyticus]|uniref:Formate hydrogenlyase transcriptional activator n=1 Tax=Sandaracinus amylolyticus TaxID=927083 RepID=A0A0F6W5D7_9BACT|nr:sigma 54-interacting transcriptional regulator [Sandaracinus amylolyticus]AKF07912.1 Formate hydrogenlyase transcriptional activator [Sandaracinus amylolyticus]
MPTRREPRSLSSESDAMLEALFTSPSVGLALLDADLRFVRVNALVAALDGAPIEAHVGRTVEDVMPSLAPVLVPLLKGVLERGEPRLDVALPTERAQVLASFFPMRLRDGSRGVTVVCVDRSGSGDASLLGRLRFDDLVARLSAELAEVSPERLDRTLEQSLEAVATTFDADRALVMLLDAQSATIRRTHEWHRADLEALPGLEVPMPVAAFPWASEKLFAGQPVLSSNFEGLPEHAEAERLLLHLDGPGSTAIEPLRVGPRTLGIVVFSWRERARDWTPLLRARLRTVAELIATALDRRELERTAHDRLRFEQLLSRISTSLIEASAARLDDAIGSALRMLAQAMEVDRAYVYEIDEETATARSVYQHAEPGVPEIKTRVWSFAKDAAWGLAELRAGRALVVPRVEELPERAAAERDVLLAGGVRSLLIAPMRVGDRLIGIVGTDTRREIAWSDVVVSRAQLVGEIFASAVDRRRLERLAAERQRIDALLATISTALIDAPAERIDEELGGALARICVELGLVRALVMRFDRAASTFRVTHHAGAPAAFDVGVDQPRSELEGALAPTLSRGVHLVRTAALPPGRLRETWERQGIVGAAAAALRRHDDVVGALVFLSREERAFEGTFRARILLMEDVVAHALARRDAELARRAAFDELERMKAQLERERDYLREEIRGEHDVHAIVAQSAAQQRVMTSVEAVASTSASVLVRGETGVGKELIARAIHARSPRAERPLVKVDCASIPHELFEREFFGQVRGAIAGALEDRVGRFELADRGTLFLDEVGEIPLEMQSKLLRVLQDGALERIGDPRTRRVDVRVIAATNRDLEADVAAGRFRRDLYYRLGVFPLEVPPLRERAEDVLPLARYYLRRSVKALGRGPLELTRVHERLLIDHDWPGNVRELANVIERAVILSSGSELRLDLAMPKRARTTPVATPPAVVPSAARDEPEKPAPAPIRTESELRELERANLLAALERAGGRIAGRGGAAEVLGVRPSTLRDRMRAFGIEARHYRRS